jgi:FkbM family methyltransferase
MKAKQHVKSIITRVLARTAITGGLDRLEAPILRLIPRILDPDVLPQAAIPRPLRGLSHEALCNPYNPFHRSVYWFGRLHERGLDDLLRLVLRPGDTFIDVGANHGHMSSLAAALVGPLGLVHAFEPHPELSSRFREFVHERGYDNIHIYDVALGDRDGVFTLHVNPNHLGASTIREIDSDGNGCFLIEHQVKVVRGDDVLQAEATRGRTFLKIDVEGSEPAVIEGMAGLIGKQVEAMVVEVTPEWQGGPEGVARMFDRLEAMGFRPFLFSEPGSESLLTRLLNAGEITEQTNAIFLKEEVEKQIIA